MKVNEIITNKIIEQLEKGSIPWMKPWGSADAINYITRKRYKGVNGLLLQRGGEYLTFKQVHDLGGKVKKGAKSEMVIFYTAYNKEIEVNGESKEKAFPVLRYYNIFHLSDTEGIESKLTDIELDNERIENPENIARNYIAREGINYKEIKGSNRACYGPDSDSVTMPGIEQFDNSEFYYSVLFHELTHSTGHTKRLGRITKAAKFGSEEYSKEELVAEIGSATLCRTCGIDTEKTLKNSAAYVQSWIHALKNDFNFIISASSKAEKAVELILGE